MRTLLKLLILLPVIATAETTADLQWDYAWEAQNGDVHAISVTIPGPLVEKAFLGQKDMFDFKKISVMILNQAKALGQQLSDDRVSLRVTGSGINDYEVSASALPRDKALADARMNAINDYVLNAMIPVEQTTYYTFDLAQKRLGIEYNEIAGDYKLLVLDTLIALSKSLGTDDPHALRDGLLVMLQSIEYDDLSKDDFPLLNPARMLIERRGDCESKQVFMATAIKLLFPNYQVELIQLFSQEHIVMSYTDEFGERLFMDATGPVPAGESPYYINPIFILSNGTPYEIIF